jgi:uncharacterized protein YecT (DUF1311 family)
MQLLEITLRITLLPLFILSSFNHALADGRCNNDTLTNPEIIKCSQEAFERIDHVINEQYNILIKDYSSQKKSDLISTQRSWIRFKDKYCGDVYDSVYPGHEAPIDRLSCLTQITSTRLNELIYLRTGVINDGFHKAVSIVNKQFTNYDLNEAINIVGAGGDLGELWRNYAMKNCTMTRAIFNEDTTTCTARMKFQAPIN